MTESLRILQLEDSEADAELITHVLRKGDIQFTALRVETQANYESALHDFQPDIILADYKLPQYNGMQALEFTHEHYPFLPFIFITGTMGEEVAVETLRKGASDYILKDRMMRLPAAITLALNNCVLLKQRRQSELELELAAKVFEQSNDGIMITDAERNIVSVNRAFTMITGYQNGDVLGENPSILKSDKHDASFYQAMWAAIKQSGHWKGEIYNRCKNGELIVEWLDITVVNDSSGKIANYIGVFTNISEHKQLEERVIELMHYDAVTGLPSLLFFHELLAVMINEARRTCMGVAIVRVDMINFHNIDDQLGFAGGDQVLKILAQRLVDAAAEHSIVTRISKDNFIVACSYFINRTQIVSLTQHLLDALQQRIEIEGVELYPDAIIGISLYPEDGNVATDLTQKAGIALTQAKESKVENVRVFTHEMNDLLLNKLKLTSDMRKGIERDEFEVYYQPQISLGNGQIRGMEALVRWNHPSLGFLPPNNFIPLAEEAGLINSLGLWVLEHAIQQIVQWQALGLPKHICIAVNLSTLQFDSHNLVDQVRSLLTETGLAPECLELELTESALMSNIASTNALLMELKALGIRLSIDDFGTGYSSLAYLQQFSVDKLKIDKSFIDHIVTNPNDNAIVQATIAMSKSLGLTVIAEGVETEGQAECLRTLQCEEMQGYLFCKPLSAKDIWPILKNNAEQYPQVLLR